MRYQELLEKELSVYDCNGKQIAMAREVNEVEGGLKVKVLANVINDKGEQVKAALTTDETGEIDCAEAEMFLRGGYIAEKR